MAGLALGGITLTAIFVLYHSIAAPFAALDRRIHEVAPGAHIVRSRVGSWLPESVWDALPREAGRVAVSGGFVELTRDGRSAGTLVLGSTCKVEALVGRFDCQAIMSALQRPGPAGLFVTARVARRLGIGAAGYRPVPGTKILLADAGTENYVTLPGGQVARIAGLLAGLEVEKLNDGYVAAGELTTVAGLFGHPGQIAAVYMTRLPPAGADRLQAAIGDRAEITRPSGQTRYLVPVLETLRVFLLVGAIFAGMTGGFLAWATLVLSAVERRRVMATLQAQGARSLHILAGFCAEGAVIGAAAAAVALPLGTLAGSWLVRSYTSSLLGGTGVHLRFEVPTAIYSAVALLMIVMGVAATVPAAVSIMRQPTARVLSAATNDEAIGRLSPRAAAIGTLAGGAGWLAALWLMLNAGAGRFPLPVLVASTGVYATSTIVLTIVLSPLLAGWLPGLLLRPRRLGLYRLLVQATLTRSPSRTGFTVCVIAMGISLTFGISTVLASVSASVHTGAETVLDDRLLLVGRAVGEPTAVSLDDEYIDSLAATRGVAATSKLANIVIDRQYLVIASEADAAATAHLMSGLTLDQPALAAALERGEIVANELLANTLGVRAGDSVTLPTATGHRRFTIADIGHLAAADENGVGKVLLVDYHTGQDTWGLEPTSVFVTPDEHTDPGQLAARLPRPGRVHVYEARTYAAASNAFMARVFQPLINIGRLALAISVAGVVNMLLLSLLTRRQERAAMTAIGMTRRQEAGLVLGDALVLGGLGAIFGLVGGAVFAWGITMASPLLLAAKPPLHVDALELARAFVTSLAVCALGAIVTLLGTPKLDVTAQLGTDS